MNNKFQELFAPTVVLVTICLIASLLLAATYLITEPIIAAITLENANKARAEVLPEATGFKELEDVMVIDGVTEIYEAVNGTGYVVTAQFKGFGGLITVMTGLDSKGRVAGVKVTDASQETPGLGSKATVPDYVQGFVGAEMITADKTIADATYVAHVTGATYTSRAVFSAVSAALVQFSMIGGGL